jgi:hypothetical protein
MPSLPALLRLAEALGVRVERFAKGVDDPEEVEAGTVEPPKRPKRKRKGGERPI